MLGQTPNFTTPEQLAAYCQANPTLQAGYAPGGQAQVLDCTEWPNILPQIMTTGETATSTTTASTATTCLQFFGSTEPCVGPIGQYTLLTLIALGLGLFWFAGRSR